MNANHGGLFTTFGGRANGNTPGSAQVGICVESLTAVNEREPAPGIAVGQQVCHNHTAKLCRLLLQSGKEFCLHVYFVRFSVIVHGIHGEDA